MPHTKKASLPKSVLKHYERKDQTSHTGHTALKPAAARGEFRLRLLLFEQLLHLARLLVVVSVAARVTAILELTGGRRRRLLIVAKPVVGVVVCAAIVLMIRVLLAVRVKVLVRRGFAGGRHGSILVFGRLDGDCRGGARD